MADDRLLFDLLNAYHSGKSREGGVLAVARVALERAAEVADDADDDMPFAHETADYIRGHIAGTSSAARAIRAMIPKETT